LITSGKHEVFAPKKLTRQVKSGFLLNQDIQQNVLPLNSIH